MTVHRITAALVVAAGLGPSAAGQTASVDLAQAGQYIGAGDVSGGGSANGGTPATQLGRGVPELHSRPNPKPPGPRP
ncbi:MAG: hypothetical protein ACFBSD_17065, partial [Paracoccaceae bacterium]